MNSDALMLKSLIGKRITDAYVKSDSEGDQVRLAVGDSIILLVEQDEEGNGPGSLHIYSKGAGGDWLPSAIVGGR